MRSDKRYNNQRRLVARIGASFRSNPHLRSSFAHARLEKQGRSVIHLEIGEPDFPTPPHIIEAGKRAMDEGYTKYGPTAGLPELRESIARYIGRTRGAHGDAGIRLRCPRRQADHVFHLARPDGEAGDEVIYPDPGFPIYESMIRYTGATPVPIPLVESRGFSFDLDLFRSKLSDRTRLVILNSPENPTGGTIPADDMAQIAAMLRDRDVMVLSDEIYSRLCYDGTPVSITSFEGMQEKTIILDGFSKTYSMTGWRLGYGVMPLWLAEAVNTLMVNSNSCTATFTQRAGIAALEGPQDCVDHMASEFRRRRDAFCAGLNTIPGFRCHCPPGAVLCLLSTVAGHRHRLQRAGGLSAQ